MKKFVNLSLLAMILALTSSCVGMYNSTGVSPAVFSSWKDKEFSTRVDNSVSVTRNGESCVTNVLGLFAFGDSSVESAKRAGGIKSVNNVDHTYNNFAFFFQKGCTVVNGN